MEPKTILDFHGNNQFLKITQLGDTVFVGYEQTLPDDPDSVQAYGSFFFPAYQNGINTLLREGNCSIEGEGGKLELRRRGKSIGMNLVGPQWSVYNALLPLGADDTPISVSGALKPEQFRIPLDLEEIVIATAPPRIDLAGGTTDIAPFVNNEPEGGATINVAIDLPSTARLLKSDLPGIFLQATDRNESFYARNVDELKYDGNLDLLKAVIKRFHDLPNLFIETYAIAPGGSGLGSSAAIAVALMGLLTKAGNHSVEKGFIADQCARLESAELGFLSGKQDQYAAAIGGLNLWKFHPNGIERFPVDLSEDEIAYLEERFVLCYTGHSRLSGDANRKMIANYENNVGGARDNLRGIRDVATKIYSALKEKRFDKLHFLLNQETSYRSRLHPEIMDGIDGRYGHIGRTGLENGALAAKILGAGAGGCLLFYVEPDKKEQLVSALESTGSQILPVRFNYEGLVVK